jgi:putative ABC transport system ATP-binding protein
MVEESTSASSPSAQDPAGLMAAHIVRAVAVRKTYYLGGQPVHALRGVDFSVLRGEYVSIMGPSGSGKSTLFNMIGGLDKPNDGFVFIDEVNIAALDNFELAWLRCHKIGYIFQTFNLIPVASALENVMLPMLFAGMTQAEAQDKAADLLRRVGLGERILHKPKQMSGGQQQRVACARALASRPRIVFADEPTGNLDSRSGAEVLGFLRRSVDAFAQTVVMVTHDPTAASYADRVLFLADGRIVEQMDGPTADRVLERMKSLDPARG